MAIRVGCMGAVFGASTRAAAWEAYSRMLAEDEALREEVRRLADTDGGRLLLDESRGAWRERGFEAPFEFLFRGEGGAQELR